MPVLTDFKLIAVVLGIAGVTTLLLLIGEACPFLRGDVILADDSNAHEHGHEVHIHDEGHDDHAADHELEEDHHEHHGFTNVRSIENNYMKVSLKNGSSMLHNVEIFRNHDERVPFVDNLITRTFLVSSSLKLRWHTTRPELIIHLNLPIIQIFYSQICSLLFTNMSLLFKKILGNTGRA